MLERPCQGGVDVGALVAHEGEVVGLTRAAHPCRSMPATRPRTIVRKRRGRPSIVRPRASRRGQRRGCCRASDTACRRVVLIGDEERAAGQPAEHIDRRLRRHTERGEHELDCGQGGATGEGRQRPQPALVVGKQQVVAPCDRRPQSAAALWATTGRIVQHDKAVVESLRDLFDRERAGTRRCQLDRQRETVQRPAQNPEILVVAAHRARPVGR